MNRRSVHRLLGGIALAGAAFAQSVVISPVPFLRPDGNIPSGHPETGVYLDRQNAQAVVFYRPSGSSAVKRITVPIGSGINPTVGSRIERLGDEYSYTYTVKNDAFARNSVELLELNDPALGRSIKLRATAGAVPANGIGEFRLVERRKPGLIRVLVRGSVAPADNLADVPESMKVDIAKLQGTSLVGSPAFVFGPRFGWDVDPKEIADDFRGAAEMLVNLRQLDADSPYMRGILVALQHAHPRSAVLGVGARPSTARETEFDQALRAALE